MGGTACHYSSYSGANNGCASYPDSSVLSAGAIAGIVIGSLLGIALVIFLIALSYKLIKRNGSSSYVPPPRNIYNVPVNEYYGQPEYRRSEMRSSSKPPVYSERPVHNDFYANI